jgi:hypothetical protein
LPCAVHAARFCRRKPKTALSKRASGTSATFRLTSRCPLAGELSLLPLARSLWTLCACACVWRALLVCSLAARAHRL